MISRKNEPVFTKEVIFVFAIGILIRIFAGIFTFIINPDGPLYIHQARALYYGLWHDVTGCGLSYIPNYPFFICIFYPVFHNWETAARAVCLFFGSATLFPVFFLLKRFFSLRTSALALLVFAMIPVFVSRSADVLRDPVSWFFMSLGLWLFIRKMDSENGAFSYFFASLAFLMALWARIETFLFIVVSALFLIFFKQEKKLAKTAAFMAPFIVISGCAFVFVAKKDIPVGKIFRLAEITQKISSPLSNYGKLRKNLKKTASKLSRDDILRLFLPQARTNIWLIALGTLVNRILEGFFYPLLIFFIFGMRGLKTKIAKDKKILYLFILAVSGLILLYAHVMDTWVLDNRFLAVVIIPSVVFAGFGVEFFEKLIEKKAGFSKPAIFFMICLFIILSALPKNLQMREKDKQVFKQIGFFIEKNKTPGKKVLISSSFHIQRWLAFYANLDVQAAPCPQEFDNCWDYLPENPGAFLQALKQKNIKFLLWEENHWQKNFLPENLPGLKNMGSWDHPDTGKMILYKVEKG